MNRARAAEREKGWKHLFPQWWSFPSCNLSNQPNQQKERIQLFSHQTAVDASHVEGSGIGKTMTTNESLSHAHGMKRAFQKR
jgi:hypothetical protein